MFSNPVKSANSVNNVRQRLSIAVVLVKAVLSLAPLPKEEMDENPELAYLVKAST